MERNLLLREINTVNADTDNYRLRRRIINPLNDYLNFESNPIDWSQIKKHIISVAAQEWSRWDKGQRHETNPSFQAILKEYYLAAGHSMEVAGKAAKSNLNTDSEKRSPWSAAFISYVMKNGGAEKYFKYSSLHWSYIVAAKRNRQRGDNPFQLFKINEEKPEIGDLVCNWRGDFKMTYENVQDATDTKSHCDVVVEVDESNKKIWVIGGNTGNEVRTFGGLGSSTVGKKSRALDSNGYLVATDNIFALLKIRTSIATPTETKPRATTTTAALEQNRQYAQTLGWYKYIYEINDLLLPYSGQSNVSLSEDAFIDALAGWQREKRLKIDGVLGPITWEKMKPELKLSMAAPAPTPASSLPSTTTSGAIPDYVLVGLLDFFGYNPSKIGMKSALSNFQKDKAISPANGLLDSNTQKRLEKLKQKLVYAVRAGINPDHMNRFRLTHYYVVDERDYPATSENVPVLDKKGNILTYVNADFYLDMCINGSGFIRNKKMLNVAGSSVNVSKYSEYTQHALPKARKRYAKNFKYTGLTLSGSLVSTAHAFAFKSNIGTYGYGVLRGISLKPFKTLAADLGLKSKSEPRFKGKGGLVPAKTKVFVLDLAGEKMPDGTIHDGWCVVNDTGGAINGAHFDVFTGTKGLRSKVNLPHIGQIWFDGMEQKIDTDYSYGLYKND